MNCQQCSKIIPDGFIDCPWCGSVQPTPASIHPAPVRTDWLTASALSLSMLCLFGFSAISISRDKAANPLASPAYFKGEWFGIFFWAIIILTIFAIIREKKIRSSIKFLAIVGPGFLLGLMSLSKPTPHLKPDPTQLRHIGQIFKGSEASQLNKWDLAIRPLYLDLVSRNREYVDEVSKLDDALQPLYSPASFAGAKSVQAILDALELRLAVANKYADIRPVLKKVPEYVAKVDASDEQKQEYLAGFNESFANGVTGENSVFAMEQKWLVSAIDLYRFSLAHLNSYRLSSGRVIFRNDAEFAVFSDKLNKSRRLYSQFLKAYTESRRARNALLAQMGLQPSDAGLENSK